MNNGIQEKENVQKGKDYLNLCSFTCSGCGSVYYLQKEEKKRLDNSEFDRLEVAAKLILKWEGGYVNDPVDRGGATNKGVTWETYKNLANKVLGTKPTKAHFESLTDADVIRIIKYYFDRVEGSRMKNGAVSVAITDYYWGSGFYAIKRLQRGLNQGYSQEYLAADGIMGAKTLRAINNLKPDVLLGLIHAVRKQHYQDIVNANSSQMRFFNGWNNRNDEVYSKLMKYV
ncbi:MAG: hypothetical protein COA58_02895 [Bacteroidetes bacterium]|nr:MAG: hypothetical protein COA58_02895 [Bacteroidota bacterium]